MNYFTDSQRRYRLYTKVYRTEYHGDNATRGMFVTSPFLISTIPLTYFAENSKRQWVRNTCRRAIPVSFGIPTLAISIPFCYLYKDIFDTIKDEVDRENPTHF